MKLFITKGVNLFLISLNVFTYNVDSFNCTDLAICCALRYGTKVIPTPPSQCTALALSRFDEVVLAELNLVKGTLPLVVIDDSNYLWYWPDIVRKPASEYITRFKDLGVDVVAFDIIHYIEDSSYSDTEFTANIAKFLDDAKREFPQMLFGIALSTNEDPIRSNIDVKVLNKHVDFYLLKFILYRSFDPVQDHRDMVYVISKDDIIESLSIFRNAGMDTNKLIYTIDLRIFTYKANIILPGSFEDMSYSELCSKKVSIHRKFCYNSIEDLFEKAQLRVKEKLLGIYVDNSDFDDCNGSCLCTGQDGAVIKFKGISVIAGACCDDQLDVCCFMCVDGSYPIFNNP